MLRDHLGRVGVAGLKFISKCQKVKILEAIAIRLRFETLYYCVKYLGVEVINLLKDEIVDYSKVSFFTKEAKDR